MPPAAAATLSPVPAPTSAPPPHSLDELFTKITLNDVPIPRRAAPPPASSTPREWGAAPPARLRIPPSRLQSQSASQPQVVQPYYVRTQFRSQPGPQMSSQQSSFGVAGSASGATAVRAGTRGEENLRPVHADVSAATTSSLARSFSTEISSSTSSVGKAFSSSGVSSLPDFPRLFKVRLCPNASGCVASNRIARCFDYHPGANDRRREHTARYSPRLCPHVSRPEGCRNGERCWHSHNDFEVRFHPDRFAKLLCRNFAQSGTCGVQFCSFSHEVKHHLDPGGADVIMNVASAIDAVGVDKAQALVANISEEMRAALRYALAGSPGHSGTTLRAVSKQGPAGRNGPRSTTKFGGQSCDGAATARSPKRSRDKPGDKPKRHCGWKLDGFVPNGREEQKVKYLTARVALLKKALKEGGEPSLAAILKTSSLRDMMSSARKLAEEVRERERAGTICRGEGNTRKGAELRHLVKDVFAGANWSCHAEEGDNPFIVTPQNQNEAITALGQLVDICLAESKTVGA